VSAPVAVRSATAADAAAIAAIYNVYVRDTVITFEVDPVSDHDMAGRIAKVQAAGLPYLVAEDADAVLGFAYASPFQERAAYAHSIESTVYLVEDVVGRGTGTALYAELLERLHNLDASDSAHAPVHRVYARIALPNHASAALHDKFGFTRVALLGEVGRKFDRWIDVGFWELELGKAA